MSNGTQPSGANHWLVLDIGNTHTVAGLYEQGRLRGHIRFRTDAQATADEYRAKLSQLFEFSRADVIGFWSGVSRVIVSSVVPALEGVIESAARPVACLFVCSRTRREFELDLPFPEQLGADRLANVTGALTLAKPPFLIVDAGTATTFCLVDARPAYIGGNIVPGLETGWKALQARAAKLFSVELIRPESSIGRTTETQLQSGVLLGYEALIEGMTDRLLRDAGPKFSEAVTIFATGGCINLLKLSSRFRVEEDLTLLGLLRYGQLTG